MKQETLTNIITKLANDKKFAITVINLDNGRKILINATNDYLENHFGSAQNFFEKIFADGVKKIRVCPKEQNGTCAGSNGTRLNFKRSSEPEFDFEFHSKSQPEPQPVTHYAQPIVPQLNGETSNVFKIHHYDILNSDYQRVKAERNQLRETKIQLEKKIFEMETLGTKAVDKAKANADMMNSELVKLLAPLVVSKLSPAAPVDAVGLSGLSPVKNAFLKADDSFLQELHIVSKGYEIPGFEEEIEVLLKKYNLK